MFNFSDISGAYLCAQRPLALYISQPQLPSAVVLKTLKVNFFISAFTKSDLKVCMCVWGGRGHICYVTLHLTPLRQGLTDNQELGWQPASSSDPPVSTSPLSQS